MIMKRENSRKRAEAALRIDVSIIINTRECDKREIRHSVPGCNDILFYLFNFALIMCFYDVQYI